MTAAEIMTRLEMTRTAIREERQLRLQLRKTPSDSPGEFVRANLRVEVDRAVDRTRAAETALHVAVDEFVTDGVTTAQFLRKTL